MTMSASSVSVWPLVPSAVHDDGHEDEAIPGESDWGLDFGGHEDVDSRLLDEEDPYEGVESDEDEAPPAGRGFDLDLTQSGDEKDEGMAIVVPASISGDSPQSFSQPADSTPLLTPFASSSQSPAALALSSPRSRRGRADDSSFEPSPGYCGLLPGEEIARRPQRKCMARTRGFSYASLDWPETPGPNI